MLHFLFFRFGALIFDEVKVIAKVLWNCKNNALVGFAMTPEEMSSLHDIYLNLDEDGRPKKTNYILQFLWRDVCSTFDVLGPYYTCVASLEHKFIIACVMDAIQKLHNYGFKTKVLICDGASSNLSTIKYFMGTKGIFGHNEENGVPSHKISPKVWNPWTQEYLYFIICPTHQLKNMVGQLHASRQNGTKSFIKDDVGFGWKPIREIYQNDVQNARMRNLQRVPQLKLSYVVRDAWTRLNVKPSKILQQRPMIAAIRQLADDEMNNAAKASINETANYLENCSEIFEYGILSHHMITSRNQTVLQRMTTGQQYFESWITSIIQDNPDYKAGSSTQRDFLSWQTWDLQRVMLYGFKEFAEDFFQKYQNNFFISPKRFNGSAIETLFSQFKYITGSKLSAANYAQARAAYLMKVDIHGRHHGEADYRNVALYLRQQNLQHN